MTDPTSRAGGDGRPGAPGHPDALADPETPGPPPPAAGALFGDRLSLARRYAELLATDGVVRGLVGPREAPRLWERHLLNSVAITELLPPGSSVLDVGSGAGLPGLVLAIARPDLRITLVESMARRTTFLEEAVAALGLADQVAVVRARAEEYPGELVDVVTARAVAPLDRLARWCLPLLRVHGRLLAIKGGSAADEVATHQAVVERCGGGPPEVHHCGAGLVDPPVTVVAITRDRAVAPPAEPPARRGTRSSAGRRGAEGGQGAARRTRKGRPGSRPD